MGLALNYRPFALNIPDSDIFSEDQPLVMRGSGKAGVFLRLLHYDNVMKAYDVFMVCWERSG